jgi:hypothetical protein
MIGATQRPDGTSARPKLEKAQRERQRINEERRQAA